MCDYANIWNVVDYLFAFFERVKIYLTGWLHPFVEEMRRKLLLLTHNIVVFFIFEVIAH